MAMRCPECGSEAQDRMRFCGACGSPLRQAAAPVRERRLVSVLFCDLVGFTTFSESRDAEDVRDVLAEYFAAARRIIAGYGGTIEKFIGDAVMAVWGAPLAREDDAERSVRAGLEIVQAVGGLSERLAIPELRVRVGALTGEAVVEIGSTHEGMVTGDVVNTAARIQSIAEPGTVFVDDTTRLVCERVIAFESGGSHTLKGKTAPVRVWRAVRVLDGHDRAVRSGVVEPPLIGRELELETALTALAGLRDPDARVRVLGVVGEAGIGKSRLGWELEASSAREAPIGWHRGRSRSFGEGTGLSALADIVRVAVGIARDDPAESQRSLVAQVVGAWFENDTDEVTRVARAVRRLLDLDDRRESIEQGELFSAWRALFERLAADGPVVLVFEEIQLADQALFDFVAHLRDWTPAAPILILVLSRPDRRVNAITGSGERIELQRLSDVEMDKLVAGAVHGAPPRLLAAIRAEGGGLPLYAVETLRALADRGILAVEDSRYVVQSAFDEVTVPPTIRALVSSRLDRLGPLERRVLAAGAVIGESFSVVAAAVVAGIDEAHVRPHLDALVEKALLEFETDPHSSLRGRYMFVQGVVRRVALAGLSRRDRKRAHLAAVEHLSQQGEFEPDRAAVLAGHLLAAEEADPDSDDVQSIRNRARSMLGEAAERAAATGALTEALSLFDRAAQLTSDAGQRAGILERAGAVAFSAGDAAAASARYRAAEEIHAAARRQRECLRVRALRLRASYHLGTAGELLPALRELDAALGDERDAIKALAGNILAFTLYQCGEHEEALAVAARSAAIAEECADSGELVAALSAQGSALQELERPQEAIALQRRAIPLAEHHGPRRFAPLLGNLAVSLTSIGRYAEAADRAREAIATAQRGAERLLERWARLVLARALCSLGEWDEAVAEIESVKEHIPPFYIGMAIAPLVVIALVRGQQDAVRELVAGHDRRCSGDPDSATECDFRVLRAAALLIDRSGSAAELSRVIVDATTADFAEWAGWLAPIVDRVVAEPGSEPLAAALAALQRPGALRQTPPVLAQAHRLEAHLAVRAGAHARAGESFGQARRLASDCRLAFETAVVALEQGEHAAATDGTIDTVALVNARETFSRLRATPWLARAQQFGVQPDKLS